MTWDWCAGSTRKWTTLVGCFPPLWTTILTLCFTSWVDMSKDLQKDQGRDELGALAARWVSSKFYICWHVSQDSQVPIFVLTFPTDLSADVMTRSGLGFDSKAIAAVTAKANNRKPLISLAFLGKKATTSRTSPRTKSIKKVPQQHNTNISQYHWILIF